MTTEPLEETYFNWLYSKFASVEFSTPSLSYVKLFRALHTTEFVWIVTGDDNRAGDGIDLRYQFQSVYPYYVDREFLDLPCSMLELLVAFAAKVEFHTEIEARLWFWEFLRNLGVDRLNDTKRGIEDRTAAIMDRLIWRTYSYSGEGGLFPLENPTQDQTKVEIWYQFCGYLIEKDQT